MKVCPVCKAEYPDESKFCENDGSPLEDKDGKKCPHCGAQLKGKGKFCPECGKPKPSGVKTYRCDKCGWKPADPAKPPRFCPECGDVFDANDEVKE